MITASLQTLMRMCAGLSILGSIAVVIKYNKYPILQRKEANKIICCIAVCDFCFSIGTMIGRPHDETFACDIQSAVTTYFSLVSIFWTTAIAFMVYYLVHYQEQWKCFHSIKVHAICWGLSLLLTFLPLTTNTFGNPDSDHGWCFLDHRHDEKSWTLKFWLFASYYFWIFAAAFSYVYMLWSIFRRLSHIYHVMSRAQKCSDHAMNVKIRSGIQKLSWYPIIIIACWLPSALYDLREGFDQAGSYLYDVCNLLSVLKGFFNCVAFFYTTRGSGVLQGRYETDPAGFRDSNNPSAPLEDSWGSKKPLLFSFDNDDEDDSSSEERSSKSSQDMADGSNVEGPSRNRKRSIDNNRCSLDDETAVPHRTSDNLFTC